jgi:gamma-glutamylaminecyclotransferase
MHHLLFVFGTLKQGHANFHINQGRRVPGDFVTAQAHPLFIIGPRRLPWLLERPGQGLPVVGQLFEADDAALARMDELERIDDPLWYQRRPVDVRPVDTPAAAPRRAWVYFGSEAGFAGQQLHAGPVAEYTPELAARYVVNVR